MREFVDSEGAVNNVVALDRLRDNNRSDSRAYQKDPENSVPPHSGDQKLQTCFAEAMRRNSENQERIKKERLKANHAVLKSYRIKPNN